MSVLSRLFIWIILAMIVFIAVWQAGSFFWPQGSYIKNSAPQNPDNKNNQNIQDVRFNEYIGLASLADDVSDSALASDLSSIDSQLESLEADIVAITQLAQTDHSEEKENKEPLVSLSAIAGRADREISQKIGNLQDVIKRIKLTKKISNRVRNNLIEDFHGKIDELNLLKKKIDGQTNAQSANANYQLVLEFYKIYDLALAKAGIISASDRAEFIADIMSILSDKIEQRVSVLSGAGVNAARQKFLNSAGKISSAKTSAELAISVVWGGKSDILALAREKAESSNADLAAARRELGEIIRFLIKF